METIKLYGQTYVKTTSDLVDTLFNPSGSANGTFKRYKNRIELTHTSGEVLAVVKAVDGIALSTKAEDGRYMHSTTSKADQLFNVPSGYAAMVEQAGQLLQDCGL